MKNEINLIKEKLNRKHNILLEQSNISNSEIKKINFIPINNLTNEINETHSNFSNSITQNKILIPHYNLNGQLIGIRGRAFNKEELEQGRKYSPVQIGNTLYTHMILIILLLFFILKYQKFQKLNQLMKIKI